ncbi:MAG TPA: hypothetical protein VHS09_11795 [Polyangiaceae bacterium]|jgi:hypothetical protein|nr:hypothetical protein [Polyangiaceae bacterium]
MAIAELVDTEPESARRPKHLPIASLRAQVAVVRALADQVDWLSRVGETDGLPEQLIEELAKLGCRLLEEASSLAGNSRPAEESGVFARSYP